MVIIERTEGQTISCSYHDIVCPFLFSIMTMVLSVLLSFLLWPWYCLSFFSFLLLPCYCLSFCLFYYDDGIVCPFVLSIMTMVLFVLLSFLLWRWYCLSFCLFYYDHGIVFPFVLSIMTMVLSVLLFFLLCLWCFLLPWS
jgi:hypothetical protein